MSRTNRKSATCSVKEVQENLHDLLDRVQDGEEITIFRNGKSAGKIVGAGVRSKPRLEPQIRMMKAAGQKLGGSKHLIRGSLDRP